METKTINRVFNLAEFEKEAQWLTSLHGEGWKLIGISGNKYKFEKCQPEEWIYQLDFQKKDIEKNDYIQLFTNYGWECIAEHNNWFYFRRKRVKAEIDDSIFSDKDSKIAMCERVLTGKLMFNVALFCISSAIVALTILTDVFRNNTTVLIPFSTSVNDFVKAALPWIGCGLMIATSYSFFAYRTITSKIHAMKNPLE